MDNSTQINRKMKFNSSNYIFDKKKQAFKFNQIYQTTKFEYFKKSWKAKISY